MKKAKSSKQKVSNKMLFVSVFNILWFTVAAIVLQFVTSVELSSTLITAWFSFWTIEIFALMGIKISKVKHEGGGDIGEAEE